MNINLIIINRFKQLMSNKKSFFTILLIPVVAIILGSFANTLSTPYLNIAITSPYSSNCKQLVQKLNSVEGIKAKFCEMNITKTDLIMGNYDMLVKLNDNDTKCISVRKSEEKDGIINLIEDLKNNKHSGIYNLKNYIYTSTPLAIEKILSFMLLMLLITSTINSSLMILDKHSCIYNRIRYSPLSTISYINGNILYNFLITYMQILFAMVIVFMLKIDIGIQFWKIALIGILISSVTTSFGTFMSAFFNKELHANLCASIIALLFSLFGGTFISFSDMPLLLKKISIISPTMWFIKISQLLNTNSKLMSIIPYVVISIFFSITLYALSIYISAKKE